MAKDNKSIQLPMKISILISAIVLVAYLLSRESVFREIVLSGASSLFALILLLFVIYSLVALSPLKIGKPIWFSAITSAFIVYFGFMIILFSVNKDMLPEVPYWDVSMTGLGMAIIAFGLVIFTQRKEVQGKETPQELEASVSGLDEKIVALNEKFSKLENAIDKTFEKFDEELNKMREEDKSKGNTT